LHHETSCPVAFAWPSHQSSLLSFSEFACNNDHALIVNYGREV
jgi:hypothetical protein